MRSVKYICDVCGKETSEDLNCFGKQDVCNDCYAAMKMYAVAYSKTEYDKDEMYHLFTQSIYIEPPLFRVITDPLNCKEALFLSGNGLKALFQTVVGYTIKAEEEKK